MAKFHLGVFGANIFQYLGNNLNGCVNDLKSITKLVKDSPWFPGGGMFRSLTNERFDKRVFMAVMIDMLTRCAAGDVVWIHFSSHGTVIPVNGKNHTAVVCGTSTWSDLETFILDVDIKRLADFRPDVRLFITADMCESANLAFRVVAPENANRFVEAPTDLQMEIDWNGGVAQARELAPLLQNVAYISGCGGKGFYSSDVGVGANAYGAFTKTFIEEFKGGKSADELATACCARLPKDQQPQAHGGLKSMPWCRVA